MKVQLELQKLIGDMKLSISQSEEGSVAIVEVNQVEDLFDKTHKLFPRVRTSFLSEDLNKLSLPQSTFKNIFQHTDDIADSLSVIAPLVYDVCRVTLMRKGKEIATCQFEIRGFGDETAYYHPSGLSLSVSRRRKAEDNQFRHYTEVIITEKNADSMFNYPELINFLGKIRPGDTINQLSVSESWPILLYLGEVVRHLPKIYDALAVEPCVQLNALENKETWFSYMFVAKLLFDKKSTLHYNPETDNSTLKVIKNKIHCPFIICLPEGQFVLIMEFDSELYREESGRIVGI
ncbi:hypothetical protein, partial [Mycobacterium tuberculosis]|uniref:hypothetical protein n=1 Tax=Mycobacterium tuberculosis TaxID=1773 RepID=UPI0011153B87